MRTTALRAANADLALSSLADGTAATRLDLAAQTSLTPQALGPILADLIAAGLVIEEPSQRGGPGRPPAAYRLNPRGSIAITVLIRYSDVVIVGTDALGATFDTARLRHRHGLPPTKLAKRICSTIETLLVEAEVTDRADIQLIVTIDGVVDNDRQIVVECVAWNETSVDLSAILRTLLRRPAAIEVMSHDRMLALRALSQIQPVPTELVAIVTISNQTHLQFAIGETLISNRLGSTGSLAHYPVVGNDRICECGRTGCFGTVSSGDAVVRTYEELSGEQVPAAVDVIGRVRLHDDAAIEAVRQSTRWLGVALDALFEVHQPDRLVISGAVGPHERGGSKKLPEIIRAQLREDRRDLPIDIVQPAAGLGPGTLKRAELR